MTIGAKIGVWFTVGLVIIAAIGATAYVSTQRLIEENRWVAHTYEVKEGLAHVMSVLKDAETGQRGFLLIDKERYLEPYNTAAVEVHQDIDKLVNLTSDNAAQQESLKQVRKLADSKLAELRETIELRRKSGLESALTVVRSDRGKQIMDELRGVVAEMEGREQQLLEKRTDAAKTSANRTIWTIAVWMPIGLLALAIAAVVLMRTVRFGGPVAPPGTSGKKWSRIAIQYVSAVLIVAVAVMLKVRLTDSFGDLPAFITLYPAVLLAATIGGGGPGIVATMLAALAADYYFFPPYGQFSIDAPNDVLALGIFTGTGLFLSALAERLHRARWAEAVTVTQEQQLEELSRLNEELSQQSEELSQQSEELSQQSEELAQQNEELQTQSEEIQTLNTDLQHREDILQTLVDAARLGTAEKAVMQDVCAAAKEMFGPAASAVLLLEPQDGRLMVRAQAGLGPEGAKIESLPAIHCLAELVIAENKTAALADASLRPDLSVVKIPGEQPFQAILASPMRADGRPLGVVGIYSHQKQEWTAEQFRLAEWLAAQCTHILETLRLQEQLRRLYAEQQTIFNSVPAMIWYKDTKNNFVRVNRAVALAVGKPLDAIEGKSAYDVFPDEAERYYQDDLQVINSGQAKLGILEQMGTAGGEKRWVQTDKIPYRDERGDITGVLVLSVDVTERKQAEEALARLAAIVESSDDAILSKDIHGIIQTWNAGAERLFGYRAEEVIGQPITLLLPPERIQEEGQILERLLSGQRAEHLETVRVAKDGRRIDVSVTSSPLKDRDGQIVGASKIVHDITDRKQAEEALRKSETLLRAVTEGSPDPIFLKDRDSRLLLANAATCAAMGKPAEQIIGKTDAEVYADPAVGRAVMENDSRVMASGQTLIVEEVVPGPDCSRTFLSTKTPYRDPDGRVVGIVGVARDITDRKVAEEALRESRAKLKAAFASMTEAIFIADAEGRLLDFNEGFVRYHRFRDREECSRTIADCPRYLDAYFQDGAPAPPEMWAMPRALRGETASDVEYMLRRKDSGETWWGSYGFAPIKDESGRIVGAVVACREITDRKRAEEALRESEERLRLLGDNLPDSAVYQYVHEADGSVRFLYFSAGVERLNGVTVQDVLRDAGALHRQSPPEYVARLVEAEARSKRDLTDFDMDLPMRRPDGEVRWMRLHSRPRRLPDGRTIWDGVQIDITERERAEKALRERERLLQDVIDGSTSPIFLKDRDGKFITINASLERMLGMSREEIKGKTDYDIAPQEVADTWRTHDTKVIATGKAVQIEEPADLRDGHHVFLANKFPLVDSNGQVYGVGSISHDITERKRMEEALRKSEQEFRALAESVPNIVWATRPDGWNIYFNQQWMDYTGLTLEESYGHGWNTPFHPDDKQRAWDAWQRATQHDEPYLLECRLRRADGVYRWWLIHGTPIRDANGEIQKWFGTCTDIHERKQAEERLRDSEEQFRALADSIPNLAWWANGDGYITWYNRRWYEYTGTTPEQMEGWGWQVVHDPGELPRVLERWKAALADGKPWEDTFPLRRHDGTFKPHLSRAMPICDEQGRVVRWFGTNTDVTERIEMEKSLLTAKESAEAANVAKSQFLANMSHELRTPMNAILGMIDLALPKANDPTVVDCLRTAKGSGDLLLALLNDLLDSAKIESGKLELESTPFSLRRMLDQITRVLSVRASENGLSFRCRMPDETLDAVVGDRMRLQQVLLNLAGNAIKFTERGELEISLRALSEDGEACLEFAVRDTGIGISPTGQERLFQPFTQSDASMARRFGGTGLGLSICKSIVEMMGGRIWVESELGKGSTFYFTAHLPLAKEIPADFEVPVAVPAAACAQLRILLVEDNPANQKLATYILEDRGHLVEIAGDGQEAISLTEHNRYDVILMDVQMPGMNGLDATAAIRKREDGGSRVPIIAMTAHAMKGDRERCLAIGMDRYLSKPIDGREMIATVETLAAGSPSVAASGATSAPTPPRPTEPPATSVFDPNLALKRREAEQRLHTGKARPALTVSEADAHALVHELQVYQIELEMQNEELQRAHAAAEEASQRYGNLFDFSPVAYFVWDHEGQILEVNLRGAAMLGLDRGMVVHKRFGQFVTAECRPRFAEFCHRVLHADVKQTCEVKILKDGQAIDVMVEGVASQEHQSHESVCRAAVIDISRQKRIDQLAAASAGAASATASPAESKCPSTAAVFDPDLALKQCLNKPDLLREVIACFFKDADRLLPQIRAALEKGDLKEVGHLGHRLKGTLVHLGAKAVTEAAKQVERFHCGGGQQAEVEEAVQALEYECKALKVALTEHSLAADPPRGKVL